MEITIDRITIKIKKIHNPLSMNDELRLVLIPNSTGNSFLTTI